MLLEDEIRKCDAERIFEIQKCAWIAGLHQNSKEICKALEIRKKELKQKLKDRIKEDLKDVKE